MSDTNPGNEENGPNSYRVPTCGFCQLLLEWPAQHHYLLQQRAEVEPTYRSLRSLFAKRYRGWETVRGRGRGPALDRVITLKKPMGRPPKVIIQRGELDWAAQWLAHVRAEGIEHFDGNVRDSRARGGSRKFGLVVQRETPRPENPL